jgi:hypothetical protein
MPPATPQQQQATMDAGQEDMIKKQKQLRDLLHQQNFNHPQSPGMSKTSDYCFQFHFTFNGILTTHRLQI